MTRLHDLLSASVFGVELIVEVQREPPVAYPVYCALRQAHWTMVSRGHITSERLPLGGASSPLSVLVAEQGACRSSWTSCYDSTPAVFRQLCALMAAC